MASTTLYLDKRYKREDGKYTVKIKVSFKGYKGFLIPLSTYITSDQWDGKEIIRHPNRVKLNIYLRGRQNMVINTLHDLEMSGRIAEMSMPQVKNCIDKVLGSDYNLYSFIEHFGKVIESITRPTTGEIYRQTLIKN